MMKELDGGATRSSRRIATIEKVNQLTRSDAQAPNWFLVNYDNEAGFALVNDAKVVCPVYGISNTGSLFISDTIQNKALANVLHNIFVMAYVDSMVEEANHTNAINAENANSDNSPNGWGEEYVPGDPITPWLTNDPRVPWTPIKPPAEKLVVAPLLTQYVQKWGQTSPYNVLCPKIHNIWTGEEMNGYVGCGPLAVAMIMSHYQWPLSYYSKSPDETYEFPWDEIRDYPYRYAMSRLTREISRAYNMDAQWNDTCTPSKWTRVPQTFENFKYRKPTIKQFNDIALSTILSKVPILIYSKLIDSYGDRNAHMWVIDGLYSITFNDVAEIPGYTHYYFHCVWGWAGNSNGYFIMNNYGNTNDGYIYDYSSAANKLGYTFYDFEAIGGLTPNR